MILPLIVLAVFLFRYKREIVELRKENIEIQEKWSNFLETYTQEQTASEEEFRKVCNSFEDQDWIIYRNVTFHWRDGGSKTNPLKQGEIDFLLVHKNYGIVMVEVKGGRGWRFNATEGAPRPGPPGRARPRPRPVRAAARPRARRGTTTHRA